jgi:transcriptional regulator with XRE-family HTH domain
MRIKEIRESKGISQRQVAIALGLSPVRYGRYENGQRKPEPEMLTSIAEYFGVSVDELIGRDDADTKKEPATVGGLDGRLVEMLISLSPDQVQRVQDFVAGMKASETT